MSQNKQVFTGLDENLLDIAEKMKSLLNNLTKKGKLMSRTFEEKEGYLDITLKLSTEEVILIRFEKNESGTNYQCNGSSREIHFSIGTKPLHTDLRSVSIEIWKRIMGFELEKRVLDVLKEFTSNDQNCMIKEIRKGDPLEDMSGQDVILNCNYLGEQFNVYFDVKMNINDVRHRKKVHIKNPAIHTTARELQTDVQNFLKKVHILIVLFYKRYCLKMFVPNKDFQIC